MCHDETHASQQLADAAVWLYFRFPLGLRKVEELLAARGTNRAAILGR